LIYYHQSPSGPRADSGQKPFLLKERKTGGLEARRSASGRQATLEKKRGQEAGQQGDENDENGNDWDDGHHLRFRQLAFDKSGYQTVVTRIIAVRVKSVMERRIARKRKEKQHLQSDQHRENGFRNPAKARAF
jgi:hypothetical protein